MSPCSLRCRHTRTGVIRLESTVASSPMATDRRNIKDAANRPSMALFPVNAEMIGIMLHHSNDYRQYLMNDVGRLIQTTLRYVEYVTSKLDDKTSDEIHNDNECPLLVSSLNMLKMSCSYQRIPAAGSQRSKWPLRVAIKPHHHRQTINKHVNC